MEHYSHKAILASKAVSYFNEYREKYKVLTEEDFLLAVETVTLLMGGTLMAKEVAQILKEQMKYEGIIASHIIFVNKGRGNAQD